MMGPAASCPVLSFHDTWHTRPSDRQGKNHLKGGFLPEYYTIPRQLLLC